MRISDWSSDVCSSDLVGNTSVLVQPPSDTLLHHRRRLHAVLLDALDLRRRDIAAMSDDVLRSEAMAALGEIIAQDIDLPDSVDRHQILIDVVNEAVGLGPLEPLLRSEEHTSELQSLMRISYAVF